MGVPSGRDTDWVIMQEIEIDARKEHGGLYDTIWKASSSSNMMVKMFNWTVVAAMTIGRLLLLAIMVTLAVVASATLASYVIKQDASIAIDHFGGLLIFGLICWIWLEATQGSYLITAMSRFYSIAADMVRMGNGWILPRMFFYIFGGLAAVLAVITYTLRDHRDQKLTITELDVLGSVFSKVGLWSTAMDVYHNICGQYFSFHRKGSDLQLAISFALACGWMLNDPSQCDSLRTWRKNIITDVMDLYQTVLPPEVTARLERYLGNDDMVAVHRAELEARYNTN